MAVNKDNQQCDQTTHGTLFVNFISKYRFVHRLFEHLESFNFNLGKFIGSDLTGKFEGSLT